MTQFPITSKYTKAMKQVTTTIRAKQDLYNNGKCFTKNREYTIPKLIKTEASLMDVEIENDLGEPHQIGSWWREFEIVEPNDD